MAFHQTIFQPLMRPPAAANIDQVTAATPTASHTPTHIAAYATGRYTRSPSPPSRRTTTTTLLSPVRGSTMSPIIVSRQHSQSGLPTSANAWVRFLVADVDGLRYLRGSDASYVDRDRHGQKPTTITVTGYEVYIIEQWACARCYSSMIICYTGNPEHVVSLGSITVPKNRELWSKRLQAYVDDLSKMHARPKTCGELGTLFVTNLSSFQSGLTLINVPDGNASQHTNDFIVNENLRRMGCGGRSGITLNKPADASRDKFYQIYRLSDRVPFHSAVINIVKLVQISLFYFGLFRRSDINGLLCDLTERAINAWWHDVGVPHYRVDPADKVLGPTTIAAILGMVVGCRHRLNAAGAQVAKDPFDVEGFRQGIVTFQRQQKLNRTAKLDGPTRDKLFRITGKISASERFALTKVVKTTVQDLSGMHTQNAIDVETTDYDRFIENIYGNWLRYLWLGKMNKEFARQVRNTKFANGIEDGADGAATNGSAVAALTPSTTTPSGPMSNAYQPPRRPPLQSATSLASTTVTYGDDSSSLHPTLSGVAASSVGDSFAEDETDQDDDEPEQNENYDGEGLGSHDYSTPSAYDDVPAFVRYHRNRRSNREDTPPSKRDIKTAMRRGKTRTDEAIRSGVNRLTGNLRRRRDDQQNNAAMVYSDKGVKRIAALVENDNTPLSAGTSTPPSTATDGSTPADADGKGHDDVELIIPEPDDDEDDEEGYDRGYDDGVEDSECPDGRGRAHTRSRNQRQSEPSGSSGPEYELAREGSIAPTTADPLSNSDSQRLKDIEKEIMIYNEGRTCESLLLGPRTIKSCCDLANLAAEQKDTVCRSTVSLGDISGHGGSAIRVHGGLYPTEIEGCRKVVRRASFSVLERRVLRWDSQWDYPTEYICRLLERVKQMQEWSESNVKRAENIYGEYAMQAADLGQFCEHAISESDTLHQAYQHAVQRESYLANGIRDLDMEAARLQYEVRTLDAKLHDLDESIDAFGSKIEGMESRLQALCRKPVQRTNGANAQTNGQKEESNGGKGKHEGS
ncbi:hypothetical protein V1506DRAFT_530850 [Lipomyces tetrasporus]